MSQLKINLSEKDIERFWNKVDVRGEDECWEWIGSKNKGGYGKIRIKNKIYLAHRISWFLHNGEIPVIDSYHGMCVCHTCDNRKCVNPNHLLLGTHKDNMDDRDLKERWNGGVGEKNGSHKLTEQQVIEIREKYVPYKYSTCKLAEEYGVLNKAIHDIITRKTWKHLREVCVENEVGVL